MTIIFRQRRIAEIRIHGFTLLELMVVVSLVGILAGVLLNRLLFYREQAEKVAMEQTVRAIQRGLNFKVADLMAMGRRDEIFQLLERSPIELLAYKPKNYLGEYFAPKPHEVAPGNWYFDLQNRNLIYLVHNDGHFQAAKGEPNRLRYQIKLVRAVKPSVDDSITDIERVVLDLVVPYAWF